MHVKWELLPTHPALDIELESFVSFSRSLRLPVTKKLMQERSRIAVTALSIEEFKASNGYIEKFLRRSNVRKSVYLHGRGGSILPISHAERMTELRNVTGNYPLKNIYNMDESGLFYRIGPRKSYLAPTNSSQTIKETDLQGEKARVSIVLCVNGDGSDNLSVRYIGHAAYP